MEYLPRVVLVVSLGLALEPGLEFGFDPGESLDAVLQTTEPFIDALVNRKVPLPTAGSGACFRGSPFGVSS